MALTAFGIFPVTLVENGRNICIDKENVKLYNRCHGLWEMGALLTDHQRDGERDNQFFYQDFVTGY